MGRFLLFLSFIFATKILIAQSESHGVKEFRYDIGYANSSFNKCVDLSNTIQKLNGVTICECREKSNKITILTKDNINNTAANEVDFKWVFLDYKLNIIKQKRTLVTVNGIPVPVAKKDAPTRQGSAASRKTETVKITGKH